MHSSLSFCAHRVRHELWLLCSQLLWRPSPSPRSFYRDCRHFPRKLWRDCHVFAHRQQGDDDWHFGHHRLKNAPAFSIFSFLFVFLCKNLENELDGLLCAGSRESSIALEKDIV